MNVTALSYSISFTRAMFFAVSVCFTLAMSGQVNADIVWNYSSTDGTDTVTGQLVTDGNPGDEFSSGMTFNLISITNTFLNGNEITAWNSAGSPPPFSTLPLGQIITDSTSGTAINSSDDLRGWDHTFINTIRLGKPGVGITMANSAVGVGIFYSFTPTQTRYTSTTVPEPISGDANDDGVLNNLDIPSFVLALTNPIAYAAMFPDVDPDVVLDMNNDGVFNNGDIAGFVTALTGP